MSRKRLGSAVAVVMLVAGAAGCGGTDDAADAAGSSSSGPEKSGPEKTDGTRAVHAAYERTRAADTAKLTVSSKAVAGGQSVTAKGSGAVDLAEGDSQVTLTSRGARIEQRVVDGIIYQKPTAAQRGPLPEGKSWMKIDPARLPRSGSGDTQVSDPVEPFGYVKGLDSDDVTKVGTETVNGTQTTRYRVDVDVKTLARGDREQEQQLRRQLDTSSVPVDLWLDEQGRLRQETVRLTLRPLKNSKPTDRQDTRVTSTTTLRFDDFGTKVDVQAPPAGRTADVTGRLADATRSPQAG
ncbi:LolA-like protein [Streptomyces cellulosae]|uniref:hypothetical protein n=1 Tax=Streptomyces cellulosae TaxID=1968 RepID=UPI00056131C8|nr:hypothetical protein [Streptomyces cellulosae]